jgi:hypothetical protein
MYLEYRYIDVESGEREERREERATQKKASITHTLTLIIIFKR